MPDANHLVFSSSLFFDFQFILITGGLISGPNHSKRAFGKSQDLVSRWWGGKREQTSIYHPLGPFTPASVIMNSNLEVIGFRVQPPKIYSRLDLHFGLLIFYVRHPLNYQGAGIRTERFRSKPMSPPKVLGRGPNANY